MDALWTLRATMPDEMAKSRTIARLFSCDCAEHVAHLYTASNKHGWQPMDTIEVARRYARGDATESELEAARDAAETAAEATAEATAREAAWAAVESAAGDIGRATACIIAYSTVWALERASGTEERAWQTERFLTYLAEEANV